MKRKVFITGIMGMDGSHLADLLLEKDYEVYGLVRRNSSENPWRIQHLLDKIEIVHGDLLDKSSLDSALRSIQPDEVYNLAAQSFVKNSFEAPEYTANVTGVGALRLVEAVRFNCLKARVYQASSSEMFGNQGSCFAYNESTPFYPRSPYGCAKVFAHNIMVNYRESYNMHISCGICFNHESERRGEEFVTRKITKAVAEISKGLRTTLQLGNLDINRDWGYAPDYVLGMWLMLQQDEPDDYVLATGQTFSLKSLLNLAFKAVGIEDYKNYIEQLECYMRPADVTYLKGDPHKAHIKLGWYARTGFRLLVEKMVQADIDRLSKERSS